MINLENFEQDLAKIIAKPTDLRPFTCNGSPLDCRVFIVGFNPATEMRSDFWSFWRPGFGFDRSAWLAEYLEDRRNRPLKPGKTRRPTISNTRRVIDWIVEEASPALCLETNIYAAPTEVATDLTQARRLTAPFEFLIRTISPEIVVAHGKDAALYLQHNCNTANVITVPHFSRGWSQSQARELGKQIKQMCGS